MEGMRALVCLSVMMGVMFGVMMGVMFGVMMGVTFSDVLVSCVVLCPVCGSLLSKLLTFCSKVLLFFLSVESFVRQSLNCFHSDILICSSAYAMWWGVLVSY